MPVLRFENVSKTYSGPHNALSDISFSVNAGEMLFVTGHSGAGKSTLLKLIHLSERATRGTVLVNDKNLAKITYSQTQVRFKKVFATGLLQNQVCAGSTSAAATAPLPNCSSSGVRQSQYRG